VGGLPSRYDIIWHGVACTVVQLEIRHKIMSLLLFASILPCLDHNMIFIESNRMNESINYQIIYPIRVIFSLMYVFSILFSVRSIGKGVDMKIVYCSIPAHLKYDTKSFMVVNSRKNFPYLYYYHILLYIQ
jgi:hypothetical protein